MNIKSIREKKIEYSFDMEFQVLTDKGHFNNEVAIEYVTLKSNTIYQPHFHKNSNAFLFILEGSGKFIDDSYIEYPFSKGSFVYFPASVKHGFKTNEQVRFITVQSPPILNEESKEEDFFFDD